MPPDTEIEKVHPNLSRDAGTEAHARGGHFKGHLTDHMSRFLQNFTVVLRVSVTWLVTMAGPPLKRCQAAYCSMYASSDDKQSIGTTTL